MQYLMQASNPLLEEHPDFGLPWYLYEHGPKAKGVMQPEDQGMRESLQD